MAERYLLNIEPGSEVTLIRFPDEERIVVTGAHALLRIGNPFRGGPTRTAESESWDFLVHEDTFIGKKVIIGRPLASFEQHPEFCIPGEEYELVLIEEVKQRRGPKRARRHRTKKPASCTG